MTPAELREARETMTRAVTATPDPAGWLVAVRQIVERLNLRPESCICLPGTVANICHEVVRCADGNSMTLAQVKAACEAGEYFR
jgi:hypothetical protein